MKKWTTIRVIGIVVALGLIAFGSAENLLRTVRFAIERVVRS
jgi:hypothetical protein